MFKSIVLVIAVLLVSCSNDYPSDDQQLGEQSEVIRSMIEAVNQKDADKYVTGFADDVKVFVESEMKVNGREAMKANRANHFMNHPDVKSEIQYLVEIDNKVIMHDKVWLNESDGIGQDIVEIFTFQNNEVIRVDVIQPSDLFQNSK